MCDISLVDINEYINQGAFGEIIDLNNVLK